MSKFDQEILQKVLEDLFLVLTEKEKWVIIKRFALDNEPRWTLEKIGQKFSVTRERIRQIEKIALNKLRRTAPTTKLGAIGDLASQSLDSNGGIMAERQLIKLILTTIHSSNNATDAPIVRLSLAIHTQIKRSNKSDIYYSYCYLNSVKINDIQRVSDFLFTYLEKQNEIVSEKELLGQKIVISGNLNSFYDSKFLAAVIRIDSRIKQTENGFGLMSWRHVNPRSIRDKAYLVLKKMQKPLHFQEIAKLITLEKFDKKKVTIQAVHNELIRYEQFILVGRGLYALREWGYAEGTVADLIENLLKNQSPLSKSEITKQILHQRNVKKGTISLNLQKNPHFVRVGRALYSLDLTKK
ncbi:MAG: RpoD subfamily RNA polymerase sigma-70 subunit, RNA polymerase primary sigma factor [Candidatus Peregrinibacteria bacterium GW2011_GWF2_39_17]|nr:MAG: RpoD subfamily RNA polymerase sigma-70 subunit, RNA polymerase primary sigma factor [Candidatus Peregrinibacteria bacterium GW2011_GWF2_39_17]